MFSPENICAGLQSPYVRGEHGRSSFPLSGRPKLVPFTGAELGTLVSEAPWRCVLHVRFSGCIHPLQFQVAASSLFGQRESHPKGFTVRVTPEPSGVLALWLVRLVRRARNVVEARRLRTRWYILRLLWQWCRRETARRGTIHIRSALPGVWGRLVRAVLVTIRVVV